MKDHDLTALLAQATGGTADSSDWREYYHAIRQRLWIVLLTTVLGGILAALYMSQQETVFRARSVLFLEQEQNRVLKDVKAVREEQIKSLDMINTIVDLLSSYPFAYRVAEQMKLAEDPIFRTPQMVAEGRKLSTADAAAALVPMISASYRKNTRLIDVAITHPNPVAATNLANGMAEEYLRYLSEQRISANRVALQFLVDETDRLRKRLQVSDEAMQSFRVRENAASLETMQQTANERIAELTARLSALGQKSYQLDTDMRVIASDPDNAEELLRLPSVALEPKIARLSEAIAEQDRQLLIVSQRYRAKHPTFIALRTQLDSLIADRKIALRNVIGLLTSEQERNKAQAADLEKQLEEQEALLLKITGKNVEFNTLKRESETDRQMLDSVMSRVKEVNLTEGLTDKPISIHETALGAAPLGANPIKVYAMGIILGILTGVGIAIGINALDTSVKTIEQAENATGLPVLTAVARKKGRPATGARNLDVFANRSGLVAESFRSLRASLSMLADADQRHTFLFTSAVPSEGKTFTSANFAASLCQQGFRTLLIDADLRKPAVSPLIFGDHRKPGLSDVLAGRISLSEAIMPVELENLSVLTAGSRAPDPAELLATQKMRDLLIEATQLYDRVVIDTAPTLAVSDALLIAPEADVVCLVVRSCSTARKSVARAVKSLGEVGARPAGIVFNFVPSGSNQDSYYYSGKTYGSYGAKGVYGAGARH
jgi:capsular exopolysaccharide synthesis family protein